MNAHGWYIGKIAAYLNWSRQTVRDTIHRWNTKEMLELAAVAGEIELMEQTWRRGRR